MMQGQSQSHPTGREGTSTATVKCDATSLDAGRPVQAQVKDHTRAHIGNYQLG